MTEFTAEEIRIENKIREAEAMAIRVANRPAEEPRLRTFITRHPWGMEMSEFVDTSQRNRDIPYTQAFVDQGLEHKEDRTDPTINQMNACDFRERCIVRGGRLLALHEKGRIDYQGPHHLRIEVLQDALGCTLEQAARYRDAFKALELNRKAVLTAIHGDGAKSGLKAVRDHEVWIAKLEEYAKAMEPEALAEYTLEDARREAYREFYDILEAKPRFKVAGATKGKHTVYMIREIKWVRKPGKDIFGNPYEENERKVVYHYLSKNPLEHAVYLEAVAALKYKEHLATQEQAEEWVPFVEEVPFESDNEYLLSKEERAEIDEWTEGNTSGYSAHELYSDADGLRHEFLTKIRLADFEQLEEIRQGFRPQTVRTPYGTRTYAAKFRHFTAIQRRQAWRYINDREQELVTDQPISPAVKETVMLVMERKDKRTKAYALSHLNGGSFNDHGHRIRFEKPTPAERVYIRQALFAA